MIEEEPHGNRSPPSSIDDSILLEQDNDPGESSMSSFESELPEPAPDRPWGASPGDKPQDNLPLKTILASFCLFIVGVTLIIIGTTLDFEHDAHGTAFIILGAFLFIPGAYNGWIL